MWLPSCDGAVRLQRLYPNDTAGMGTTEPVTIGVPFPKGAVRDEASLSLLCEGRCLPVQTRTLDRWSDGSIRWALLDFQVSGEIGNSLDLASTGGAPVDGSVIHTAVDGEGYAVDTGCIRAVVAPNRRLPFTELTAGGCPVIDCASSELRIQDGDGARMDVRWTSVALEEDGRLRTCVRVTGEARGAGGTVLPLVARLHFYAASPVVRLMLTVRNSRRAVHRGGCWELGDPGSILLKAVSLVLRRADAWSVERITYSVERGTSFRSCAVHVEVYQDSSGGENWDSPAHVNRDGVIPTSFRGYRSIADGVLGAGLRATPIVALEGPGALLGATFPHFWENCPRAIEATPDHLTLGLFPSEYADLHELQGGEQKTHEVYLAFGRDSSNATPLGWCRSPRIGSATPEWCSQAAAIPYLTPRVADPHPDYLALVNAAIEGEDTFLHKRERVDEYGWRNFGDIYADHETVSWTGARPMVSHYNNQYDAVAGFAVQWLRSGEAAWFAQMHELARHVVDIDLYHTARDKPAYNGGVFWHTCHYTDAGRSTHRAYPRMPGVAGGGPSAEQDYSIGLMLHYFLTGEAASREAVEQLARWVVDMDDGSKSSFRWMAGGRTGLASATGSMSYHGPGRGPAYSILTLLNAFQLTGNDDFREKAEELIRRCIHPHDDVDALDLLDAERRWYYTVFLQALGRYLDFKAERGELDPMYAYARGSLLHYANWMVAHERPYLERPHILEYPTETWAAQDMRKAEVFMFASLHSGGEMRDRFEERARFFFDYAVRTLVGMPTRTLARPVVLLLTNGYMRAWFEARPGASAPAPDDPDCDFGMPARFEPQRARAVRHAEGVAAAGMVGMLMALLALVAR